MKTVFWLFVLLPCVAICQSPGGVGTQLKLWLKADNAASFDLSGTQVESWRYANDANKSFVAASPFVLVGGTGAGTTSNDTRPFRITNTINFLPAVQFAGLQQMNGPVLSNAPIATLDDDYSLFIVWNSTKSTYDGERIWSQWNCSPTSGSQYGGFSFVTATNGLVWNCGGQFEFSPYNQGIKQPYTPSAWGINQVNVLATAKNDLELVNQNNLATPMILSTDTRDPGDGADARKLLNQSHTLGTCNGKSRFEGNLAELIVYDRPVSGAERDRIFSYLALKYGITLKQHSLLASDWNGSTGTVFWQSGGGYDNDVFGIGRDDNATSGSGWFSTVSNSINTGSGNGAGLSGKGNIVVRSEAADMQDLESLVIGNNAAALTETTLDLPTAFTNSRRLQREWKVQRNGDVGAITLQFDINGLTTSGDRTNTANFALLVDEDGDGSFTTGTYQFKLPSSINNGVLQFEQVSVPNNAVFTVVTQLQMTALATNWLQAQAAANWGVAEIKWTVAESEVIDHYEIEWENEQHLFLTVGRVVGQPVKGLHAYRFEQPLKGSGQQHYRIKQVSASGKELYGPVMTLLSPPGDSLKIVPNPFLDHFTVDLFLETAEAVRMQVYDASGRPVAKQWYNRNKGWNRLVVGGLEKLAKGIYVVEVQTSTYRTRQKVSK